MAENNDLKFKVTGEGDDSKLSGVLDALAEIADRSREAAAGLIQVAKDSERAERSLSGVGGSSKEAAGNIAVVTQGTTELAGAAKQAAEFVERLAKATSEVSAKTPSLPGYSTALPVDRELQTTAKNSFALAKQRADAITQLERTAAGAQAQIQKTKSDLAIAEVARQMQAIKAEEAKATAASKNALAIQLTDWRDAQEAKTKAAVEEAEKQRQASINALKIDAADQAWLKGADQGYAVGAQSLKDYYGEQRKVYEQQLELNDKFANTRYALHDVSMTMGVTGAAMIAGIGLTVKAAADYETAIADMQRTSELNAVEASKLRDEFVALAQEMPVAFADIAKVGELAGQLNVPAERLAQFSETVLKFSATTNVTAESAATAMGRLDALLPDVQGNYDALGSSILKVGINSVATEQEIISTTSQIAAAGAQAGMTASQVIGLSASFASLGIAPETARGTVVRVLGLMNKAIAQGGAQLEAYADIAGMSAQKFEDSWGTEAFGQTFLNFLTGIQSEGNKAQLALADLGISAVRDQNNLLKLSQNTELVTQAFADAGEGFDNTGFLAENFAIRAETLNAKLQVLANSLQALFAEISETGAGGFGELVSFVNDLVKGATELAQVPLVQTMAAVAGGMIAAAGAALLMGAGVTRLAATTLALPNIVNKTSAGIGLLSLRFMEARTAAMSMGVATTQLQGNLAGLRAVAVTAGGALKTIGGLAATFAVGVIAVEAITAVANALKSPLEKAKDAFGDFSSLVEASSSDLAEAEKRYGSLADAVEESSGKFRTVEVAIKGGNAELVASEAAAGLAAEGQGALKGSVEAATAAIQAQTVVLGDNYRTALIAALTANEEFNRQYLAMQERDPAAADKFLTAMVSGDVASAREILAQYVMDYAATVSRATAGTEEHSYAVISATAATRGLAEGIDLSRGALEGIATQQAIAEVVNRAYGDSAEYAGKQWNEFGEEINAAGDVISSANEVVASSFDRLSVLQNTASDFQAVLDAFYGVAGGLDAMGSAAITNSDTLLSAVQSSIAAGQTMGVSAADSVTALFVALQQKGIDTAALLASLAGMGIPSIGGVQLGDVSKTIAGQKELTASGKALTSMLSSMGSAGNTAARGVGNAGRAAQQAKQEIRTLVDYASDLSKVWSRAFDIRFSGGQASDKIVTSFMDIRKAVDDANKKIAEYQQKLRELSADADSLASQRNVTEYFLMVAQSYSDTLRAGELTAKLADIDAKIAANKADAVKANESLAEAQEATNMTLVGNSAAAIRNRASVLALVQQYQSYIGALASSGMEQGELQRVTQSMRADFIAQATQLGYNSAELGVYAAAFDDVTTAINRVPRNITVTANTDPAIQAFNEMKTATDRAASAASGLRSALSTPMRANIDLSGFQRLALIAELQARLKVLESQLANAKSERAATALEASIRSVTAQIRAQGWAQGGFTGRGGKYEIAGSVHKGEYVIPKEGVNQSTGKPEIGWLMRNVLNTVGGGGSAERISNLTTINNNARNGGVQRVILAGPVALDANSLHSITSGNNGDVILDGNAIARSTSKHYAHDTRVGGF